MPERKPGIATTESQEQDDRRGIEAPMASEVMFETVTVLCIALTTGLLFNLFPQPF